VRSDTGLIAQPDAHQWVDRPQVQIVLISQAGQDVIDRCRANILDGGTALVSVLLKIGQDLVKLSSLHLEIKARQVVIVKNASLNVGRPDRHSNGRIVVKLPQIPTHRRSRVFRSFHQRPFGNKPPQDNGLLRLQNFVRYVGRCAVADFPDRLVSAHSSCR